MVASNVTYIRAFFDKDDPDGSECHVCGDICYLIMWRLFLATDNMQTATNKVLCDSCHSAYSETFED